VASFTEQATLKVVDQSTAPLRSINAELKKLLSTARTLKSITVDIKADTGKATANIKRLTDNVSKLQGIKPINISVNANGLTSASRQLSNLHDRARSPIRLRTIAAAAIGTYGTTGLASSFNRASREGTRDVDIGATSLALKELKGARKTMVDDAIKGIGEAQAGRRGGATFNAGIISQQMSEMLGVVKIGAATSDEDAQKRVNAAKFLSDQNLELARTFVALGVDTQKAQEESIRYGKALEMQGKIYDSQGNINLKVAEQQYNDIRKLIPAIGKEATGTHFLELMKYLRVSKFSLSPEGIASAMAKFEEMGTSAAVGINQMIKNLTGGGTKAVQKEQLRLGIVGQTTSTSAKGKTKVVPGAMSEADAKVLRETPQTYVSEILLKKLADDLRKQNKNITDKEIQAKFDDPVYVAGQVDKIVSDRTARDLLASMILLRQENEQFLADWRSRTGTIDANRVATEKSVLVAGAGVSSQFKGMIGSAVVAMAPLINGVTQPLGRFFQQSADDIKKIGEGDLAAAGRVAIDFAAVAGVGVGAYTLVKQALDKSGATGIIANAAAFNALVTGDDATRALGGAALGLLGAADALKGAAAALGGPALTPQGGPNAPGQPGNKPGAPAAKQPWWKRLGGAAKGTLPFAAGVAASTLPVFIGSLFVSGGDNQPDITKAATEAERDRIYAQSRTNYAIYKANERLKVLESGSAKTAGSRAGGGRRLTAKEIAEEKTALKARIAELKQEADRLSKPGEKAGTVGPDGLPLERPKTNIEQSLEELRRTIQQIKPWPIPDEGGGDGDGDEGGDGTKPDKLSDLDQSTQMFASVFETGSAAIAASGQTAADALIGAAPGIGSTIGDNAAAAISAAVANIQVNINNSNKADTGARQDPK
jgi:hypothetical protein